MTNPLWSSLFIREVLAEEEGDPSDVDASADPLGARLLGPVEEVPGDTLGLQPQPGQLLPMWVYPLAMLLVIALLLSQWKRKSPVTPGEIRVLSKTPLGREGSLAIVEVGSDDGESKKLLLGLHGNSAPRLIDYLGSEQVIAMVSEEAKPESRAMSRGNRGSSGDESFDSFLHREAQKEQKDPVLEDRNDLVDEVLKARGLSATQGIERYQQVANEPYGPLDFEESDDEDPWAAGFRNIYNQKSK